jgi:hypothetical protein
MTIAIRIRRLLFVWIAVLAAAGLSCCAVLGPIASGHLDIEAAELQSRIAPRFPQRHCKTLLLCMELSNPLLALSEGDDRIRFTVDVKVALGPRERAGRIALAARPRYVPGEGQLFLDDLEITSFEFAQLPEEVADWVRAAGTLAARRALQAHPVYTLDDSTAKGALAKRTVSDVRVVGGKLRVTFAGSGP